jgi:hypothetical protein
MGIFKFICMLLVIKISMFSNSAAFAASEVTSQQSNVKTRSQYISSFNYTGPFSTQTLYYRAAGTERWYARFPDKKYNEFIKSKEVIKDLDVKGMWYGHIRSNGDSVRTNVEYQEFTVGNYLNYLRTIKNY